MDAQRFQPRMRLTEARSQRKLSQQELGELIGTNHVNVSRWERGITRPGPYFRRRLSQLFGKTEAELDLSSPADLPASGSLDSPVASPADIDVAVSPAPNAAHTATSSPIDNEAIYDPSIPLAPPVFLVGRQDKLAQLKQRLCDSKRNLMTALQGLPGVGKTTLAITLARDEEIRAHFHDGILWAALGPEPDVLSVLSHWSRLLGITLPDMAGENRHEELAVLLRRAIGDRQMLLVIDDAWHLKDALAFKVGGPHCAHLVTTRFPGIASSLVPDAASVIQELNESDGMVLLQMLAPKVVEREKEKARELILAVGGLPLALTLLGNYLRLQSDTGLVRRVDAALASLGDAEVRLHIGEPRGPAERHTSLLHDVPLSLKTVLNVTGERLDPLERTALNALSVFPPKPNHFSEEAALFVADCNVATLDALIDTGLLEISDAGHYTLHQTVADYARSDLQDNTPYERLITYMANFVEQYKKDYENLEPEYNSILAALESAYNLGKYKELMRCVYAFIPYLRSRGLYDKAEQQLKRCFEVATNLGDDAGKSQALLYLGEIAQKQGNYELANDYLQEGLLLARQLEDPERISAMLADLGWITWKRGKYTEAETYLHEGLALAQEINKSELICDNLETLGSVAASRGDYDKSKEYMEQALIMARDIGDREKTCTLLINLGVTAGEQGNFQEAEKYFQEALSLARKLGHKEWVSLLLSNLGDIASEQSNYTLAEVYFQDGLALAYQIGHREWSGVLLINLGLIAQKQGNYSLAETHFRDSLLLSRQLNRPEMISNALYEYGDLYLAQQRTEEAELAYHEMLKTVAEGDLDLFALAKYGLARTSSERGDFQIARKLGEESLTALESMGHRKAQEVRIWLTSVQI